MPSPYAFADLYDQMYQEYQSDIPFYLREALRAEGPVLELACGTGRVLIPLAEAGVTIWGLDVTPAMLAQAERKAAALPAEARERVTLRAGNMRDFDLPERFGLVIIPFRSFLHLMTMQDQLAALSTIHRHLRPNGRLALNFFQPNLAVIATHLEETGGTLHHVRDWEDAEGRRVVVWDTRYYDTFEQTLHEQMIFEVLDADGKVVDRFYRPLALRWIYRYEFEHMLARTGFQVEALYGDFDRTPFDQESTEMVWVVRKKS